MKDKKRPDPSPACAEGSMVLTLRLRRKWFDLIAMGYKDVEFRTASDYWQSRIENKTHSHILFRNGYGDHRPGMLVEYRGWVKDANGAYYTLRLGDVRRIWNYTLPRVHKAYMSSGCVHDWLRPWYDKMNSVWLPTFRLPMYDHTTGAREETPPPDAPIREEGQISTEPQMPLDASAVEAVHAFLKQEGLTVDVAARDTESNEEDYVILTSDA